MRTAPKMAKWMVACSVEWMGLKMVAYLAAWMESRTGPKMGLTMAAGWVG